MIEKNSRRIKYFSKFIFHPILTLKLLTYNSKRAIVDRCLYPIGLYNYPNRILFLAGMGCGGSTWIKNLLARVPGVFTRVTPMPRDVRYNQNICDSAFSRIPKYGNTLFKTHLNPTQENLNCLDRNGVEKIIVSYRDLRDVAVSRYHRFMRFPKKKSSHDYVDYQALGKEKALDHSIEIVGQKFIPWIRGWEEIACKNPERFLFVRFEDLKYDPYGTFKSILQFYEIKLSEKKINAIVNKSTGKKGYKKNINNARVLPWGLSSNFRSGRIGDWQNDMNENQIQRSKELLGESLVKLGYEKDQNW